MLPLFLLILQVLDVLLSFPLYSGLLGLQSLQVVLNLQLQPFLDRLLPLQLLIFQQLYPQLWAFDPLEGHLEGDVRLLVYYQLRLYPWQRDVRTQD